MLLKIERFQFILSICFCQTGMFTAWSGRKAQWRKLLVKY